VPARAAVEGVDCVQQPQAEARAASRDWTPPLARVGVGRLGGGEEGELHVAQPLVVVAQQRTGDVATLVHGRIGAPLGAAVAVGLLGNLLAHRGQMVLAVGLRDRRQSRGALAHTGYPAPEESTGGPHRRGIDVGRREQAPTPAHRDVLGLNPVVCGCAAREGGHGARGPEDAGAPLPRAQVSQPRPRDDPVDRDDQIIPLGGHNREAGLRVGVVVVVDQALPVTVDDPDVQRPGRHIAATGKWVWLGVEAPEVSSA
jgi:hypothetical protein